METKNLFMGETEKVNQLAAALRGDIERFIENHKEEFERCGLQSDKLKAKEINKVIDKNIYKFSFNEDRDTEITHKIGDATYHNTLYSAIDLYIRLCKEFKLKDDGFQILEASTYHKNASGYSVADFVEAEDKCFVGSTLYCVYMDAKNNCAVATDSRVLMISPTEYNGKEGLYLKNGKKAEITPSYPKYEQLLQLEYSPLKMDENAPKNAKEAQAHVKINDKNKNDAAYKVGDNNGTAIFVYLKFAPMMKKMGYDNWQIAANQNGNYIIKKAFADGTIAIVTTSTNKEHNNENFYSL